MEGYNLFFSPSGRESLARLDKSVARDILKKLKWLSANAQNLVHLPLKGDLKGLYKLKVGPWRVIYQLDKENRAVVVHLVGHRREIYR